MRNIFLLIRRFSVLLFFLLLQGFSIWMLVRYSRSHNARFLEWSFEAAGAVNKRYNNITRYLSLAENNRRLAAENARLGNLLSENFTFIDTLAMLRYDTTQVDSTRLIRKYLWRDARVINNSVSMQNNYITLERGRKQGIDVDMAVTSASGIVGIVTDVSDNMSIVMSLLHRKSNTSVMLKKTGTTGILEWNGRNPNLLQLRGIPKNIDVQPGDTILTSQISLNYPARLMVGVVESVDLPDGANSFRIDVRPGANFFTLDHVSVIENLFLKEQEALEQRARRQ